MPDSRGLIGSVTDRSRAMRAREQLRRSRVLRSAVVMHRHRGLRADDVFVASFPRSGNTLVRFLLADLATGSPADFESIDRLIPNVGWHAAAPLLISGHRLIKTHERFRREYHHAVYLVRDVRDVLISWYRAIWLNPDGSRGLDEAVHEFTTAAATPYGSWMHHVRSWMEARDRGTNVMTHRFEDLRRNPTASLREIAAFVGLPDDEAAIAAALARNTSERMRQLEQASVGYLQRTHGFRAAGVRGGAVGGWRELLGERHLELLEPMLRLNRELGYVD